MNKDEILALLAEELPGLLKPTVDQLLGDVSKFMSEQITPLSDRLEKSEKVQAQPKEEAKAPKDDSDSQDPVLARVKLLEQQLEVASKEKANQEAQAKDMRFNQVLSQEIDKVTPMHKGVVSELLATRLRKEAQETETGWLAKDGKNLSENVQAFFKSDEGMHFLPSSHQNGVGLSEPKAPKANAPLDLNAEILAAFL